MPYKTHLGFGATLTFNSVLVGNIISIDGASPATDKIDTTNFGTTGGAKTSRPSALYDPGDVNISIQYDQQNAGHTALPAAQAAGTVAPTLITWSDGSSESFSAYVTSFATKAELDGLVTADVTFGVTGPITYAAGSGL